MVEFDQMWFIFQHSLPCCPQNSSIGVTALGFLWNRSSHPDPRKSPQLQIWPRAHHCSVSVRYCFPAKCFFHVGEQKIVRWCQIRRILRMIIHFKATVTHSSQCNHRLLCSSTVLVKQDSLCQFSRPSQKCLQNYFSKSWVTYPVWVYLEGINAVSIRNGWI